MDKIANSTIIDFQDEIAVKDISGNEKLMGLIKNGSIPSTSEGLHNDSFALILMLKSGELKKYPIISKDSVVASCISFEKNAEKLPEEARQIAATNLFKAADYFAILDELPESTTQLIRDNIIGVDTNIWKEGEVEVEADEKEAEDFALVYRNGEERIKKYPIDTKENVKEAIDRFARLSEAFNDNPIYKRQMGFRIKTAADKLGVEVNETHPICKYASDDFSPFLKLAIEKRIDNCLNAEFKELYSELFEKIAEFEPICFARTLEVLDKKAGVDRLWGKLGDPYFVTLGSERENSLIKESTSSHVNDKLVSLSKNAKSMGYLRKSLPSVADKFAINPVETFNSLDLNQRSLIANLL